MRPDHQPRRVNRGSLLDPVGGLAFVTGAWVATVSLTLLVSTVLAPDGLLGPPDLGFAGRSAAVVALGALLHGVGRRINRGSIDLYLLSLAERIAAEMDEAEASGEVAART